ncbi:MAG: sulfatase-like hydrolase/transferase [Verrucomicrobiaceae bacterium]|nr:sulfatase-like hydrolase/transferase [Verrucomicrobiaceae bacterium]
MKFIALLCLFTAAAFAAGKPNVIFIMTDDLDWEEVTSLRAYSDFALAGKEAPKPKKVYTPNIDKLVSESLVLTQCHNASTVCTPGRYNFLTAQYASRAHSIAKLFPAPKTPSIEFNVDIEANQWHLGRGMSQAGYYTGIVGKWHNADKISHAYVVRPPISDFRGIERGPQDPTLPENVKKIRRAYDNAVKIMREEQGFDFVSSVYLGNAFELGLPKVLSNCEHNMDWFTAGVLKFMDAQKTSGKPFFLYYAPNVPHGGSKRFLENDPRATPEGMVDWHLGSQPSREDALKRAKQNGVQPDFAWATWLDDGIGVLMKKLEDMGLADNTLIVFTTDQLTRGKWTCYQGVRVPVAIHWPGKVKPGVNKTLLSAMDVAPTILDLIGGNVPSDVVVDGKSFATLINGGTVVERPQLIEMGYGRAIIANGWKYIASRLPDDIKAEAAKKHKTPSLLGKFTDDKEQVPLELFPSFGATDELFHLADDPMEQHNLANDPSHAAKLAEMREKLKAALKPLPHGFAEFKAE